MFIITNTTHGKEYTPSKATTFEEAKAWLFECTAKNIRAYVKEDIFADMSDAEVLERAESNLDGFSYSEWGTELWYDDNSYNIMNIYDLDKI